MLYDAKTDYSLIAGESANAELGVRLVVLDPGVAEVGEVDGRARKIIPMRFDGWSGLASRVTERREERP